MLRNYCERGIALGKLSSFDGRKIVRLSFYTAPYSYTSPALVEKRQISDKSNRFNNCVRIFFFFLSSFTENDVYWSANTKKKKKKNGAGPDLFIISVEREPMENLECHNLLADFAQEKTIEKNIAVIFFNVKCIKFKKIFFLSMHHRDFV